MSAPTDRLCRRDTTRVHGRQSLGGVETPYLRSACSALHSPGIPSLPAVSIGCPPHQALGLRPSLVRPLPTRSIAPILGQYGERAGEGDTLATSPEPTPIVDEGLVEEEAQCAQIRAYRESPRRLAIY